MVFQDRLQFFDLRGVRLPCILQAVVHIQPPVFVPAQIVVRQYLDGNIASVPAEIT